jgi:hypothetical protein
MSGGRNAEMSDSLVTIHITPEEAVVLDHILARYSETDVFSIEDRAEQQALWNLQCLFEKQACRPDWPGIAESRAALVGDAYK